MLLVLQVLAAPCLPSVSSIAMLHLQQRCLFGYNSPELLALSHRPRRDMVSVQGQHPDNASSSLLHVRALMLADLPLVPFP